MITITVTVIVIVVVFAERNPSLAPVGARARSLSPAIRSEGPLSIRRRMNDRGFCFNHFSLFSSLLVCRVWIFELNSNSKIDNDILQVLLKKVICCLSSIHKLIFSFQFFKLPQNLLLADRSAALLARRTPPSSGAGGRSQPRSPQGAQGRGGGEER